MAVLEDVEILAGGGESETVEFKLTTGQKHEAARTLSAMLNGHGGTVLFGVRRDRAVIGQLVADKTLEDVTQACRAVRPVFRRRSTGSSSQVLVATRC